MSPVGGLFRGAPAYQPLTPWRPVPGLIETGAIVGFSIVGAIVLLPSLGAPVSIPASGRGSSEAALRTFAGWQVLVVVLTLVASSLLGGRARDVLALRAAAGGWRAYAGAILALAALQVVLAIVQHSLVGHDPLTDLRPFVNLVRGPDLALT